MTHCREMQKKIMLRNTKSNTHLVLFMFILDFIYLFLLLWLFDESASVS